MKLSTRIRGSGALRVLPFALVLVFFYYGTNDYADDGLGHAPTAVSDALGMIYGFAYAVASGLGVWESGRLRATGLWRLAPGRSRFRVAGSALLPVLLLSWLMLVLPVAAALLVSGVPPTPASLLPLLMALLLCAAHASIGFGVGLRTPPLITAPLMSVFVLILVTFSWTVEPTWVRHLFGQYPTTLMFGERASVLSLVPHLSLTGGIAAALWLLWLPWRPVLPRVAVALVASLAAVAGSWAMVRTWDFNPPLVTASAPVRCAGEEPRVCMPRVTASRLPETRAELVSVLADFRVAGVAYAPDVITDSMNDGRFPVSSTESRWHIPLTAIANRGNSRYQLALASVRFTCGRPDPVTRHAVRAWVARVTGEEIGHRGTTSSARRAEREIDRVNALPREQQAQWFRESLAEGCGKGG
ncbi:hypothetical protein [Streptomyces sp. NPDC020965]|uniref:DUF7224 domain-containing protein n=1 Tax=Streptomyces sp. NPDC020965 TaxID=3365105 RepID=UPI0037B2EA5E